MGTEMVAVTVEVLVAVVVAVAMVVLRLVVVSVVVLVEISVVVYVTVTVSAGFVSPPSPSLLLSLCWAPANRPMKTELSRRKTRARTHSSLERGVRGSWTTLVNRSANVSLCDWWLGASGSWSRGAVSRWFRCKSNAGSIEIGKETEN